MPTSVTPAPADGVATAAARALLSRLEEAGVDAETCERAAEVAGLVTGLTDDPELAAAALIDSALGLHPDPEAEAAVRDSASPQALLLAQSLRRLGEFGLDERWSAQHALSGAQAEVLRKMLLAVVGDPRLVVARLAQQLVRCRHARALPEAQRRQVALETRDLYAPLANRLGIWAVKWELEDLAFRELEPDEYRRIAGALNEKRRDREAYIERVKQELTTELRGAGIDAVVEGRPKHIYSIYRKMQRKRLPFESLFDVRAVRIIVATVADCYAALGIVHGHWTFLPGEFDDYIATPKDNDYRSIHTAVTGPDGRSLEIQIRTREMQDQAERGIAAHWRYKEGSARDQRYERKIDAVRALLAPALAAPDDPDAFVTASANLFDDRIYAMTPKGQVVDLPRGATPLDFAFHVHSDLGQRCRGAKVNGRIVPFDHQLANGDVVEIITGRNATPSRDWLSPQLGYLASPRSRSKLRAYFRRLDEAASGGSTGSSGSGHAGGGGSAHAGAAHAPSAGPSQASVAGGVAGSAAATGGGKAATGGARSAAGKAAAPAADAVDAALASPRRATRKRIGSGRSPVEIEGVGDLPITLARCCAPVRPQPIAGYVTLGRGVTIHRADCASLARMARARGDRRLKVDWSTGDVERLPAKILIEAFDRRGLLRDISDLIAEEHLSIEGVNSDTDPRDRIARFQVRVGVRDLDELQRLMRRLRKIPNVFKVRRAD
jgi:GTP pyrophosphokinase